MGPLNIPSHVRETRCDAGSSRRRHSVATRTFGKPACKHRSKDESLEVRVEFDVFIEIPRGTRNKYEVDHETGRLRLDRMLFTSNGFSAVGGSKPVVGLPHLPE